VVRCIRRLFGLDAMLDGILDEIDVADHAFPVRVVVAVAFR
jgi:hypothetical protein